MIFHKAKPEHQVAYDDIVALVGKHAAKLSAIEILAIAANLVGRLLAMQDHKIVSPEVAMEIVIQNLQAGNQDIINLLSNTVNDASSMI
jgi:hypothetical protein